MHGDQTFHWNLTCSLHSEIGWGAASLGFLAEAWQEIQASYLRSTGSRKSPRRWMAALIAKLWDVSWDMWSYCNYQVHSTVDEEVSEAIMALFSRIQWHAAQVRSSTDQRWTLPSVARPLIDVGSAPSSRAGLNVQAKVGCQLSF